MYLKYLKEKNMHYNYLLFLHKNILSACISVYGTHQMIIINKW